MMSCGDCRANLDDVPVGTPCPSCGGERRDAVVTPEPIRLVLTGQPVTLKIQRALHVTTSDTPRLREVVQAREFRVFTHEPKELDGAWIGEIRDGDQHVATEVATDKDDLALQIAQHIADCLGD